MTNPHYQRLTVTYRQFFEHGGLRGLWIVLVVATGLIYWQASYRLYFLIPIFIYGLVGILGIETARFVATDRQRPIYEMTLLTPLTPQTIVDGYRQAAFARTVRWFGLKQKLLLILVSVLYGILSYKMVRLVEADIQASFGQTYYFDDVFIRQLTLLIFTFWASFLIGTLPYYLLMIEVNIGLGLRFDNWLLAIGASFVTGVLVWISSLFVVGIVAYIASLFTIIHEAIPMVLVILAFCSYPLYWRNIFRNRAIANIRSAEKVVKAFV